MKKLVSFFTAASIAAVSALSVSSAASAEQYKPLFYFTAYENEAVQVIDGNTVKVSSEALKNGDVSFNVDIRIQDDTQKCSNVSAKIKSQSEYITIKDPVEPNKSTGTMKQYEYQTPDGPAVFTTDFTPFCYGYVDDNGNLSPKFLNVGENDNGQFYFSCYLLSIGTLPVLGMTSDEFPFGQFEAVISKDTPVGEYDLVFSTRDNTEPDDKGQYAPVTSFCNINYGLSDLTSDGDVKIPLTKDLKIIVTDNEPDNNYKLGDVNFDGSINALDASYVLTAYANTAVGKDSGFSDIQNIVGDVNLDKDINALDASYILSYYAYTATGGTDSFENFMKK